MLSYVLSICTRRQCRAVRVTEELQGDYLRLGEAVREEHAPDLFHEHVWARERGDDARPPVTQRLAARRSRYAGVGVVTVQRARARARARAARARTIRPLAVLERRVRRASSRS